MREEFIWHLKLIYVYGVLIISNKVLTSLGLELLLIFCIYLAHCIMLPHANISHFPLLYGINKSWKVVKVLSYMVNNICWQYNNISSTTHVPCNGYTKYMRLVSHEHTFKVIRKNVASSYTEVYIKHNKEEEQIILLLEVFRLLGKE